MKDYIQILLLTSILGLLIARELKHVSLSKQKKVIIIDTCGLIDGRIVELVESSLINDAIVIPKFILDELQLLADGNDSHKRERARFGLEVAGQLREHQRAKVIMDATVLSEKNSTADASLIALAKKRKGKIYTTDYNLNKRASAEGITVLNVNEIAQALRPVALPGEMVKIKIIQKGENRDQGVGYLEDGTMVVVENAARSRGRVVEAIVTRSLQTAAGKMVFARQVRHKP